MHPAQPCFARPGGVHNNIFSEKYRIWETPNLSTYADRRTYTEINVKGYSAVKCRTLQCSAVQYSAECSAMQCSTMQCSKAQFITVQNSAVQCSAVQYSAVHIKFHLSKKNWNLDSA